MRILIIHNKYQQKGGEDAVFEAEYNLLNKSGHQVESLLFNNNNIKSIGEKLSLGIKSIYNRQSKFQLKKAILKFKPEVIHIHNLFYIASPSMLYEAQQHNIPVVMTLHNYRLICSGALLFRNNQPCKACVNSDFPVKGLIHKCYNNSLVQSAQVTLTTGIHKKLGTWKNCIDKFITLTEFSKSIFQNSSLNVKANQLAVKPNFVEDFGIGNFDNRKDHFLFIGRLTMEKGVNVLLKAFSNTKNKLEIIGDGPLKRMVEEHCQDNKNIIYHGLQEKAFIFNALKSCKALIFPSIWYEGLPITILEAFSTGTPIVASDIDNINTIVTDGFNGIHFKTSNHEDLEIKVSTFGKSDGHRQLYTNARKTYEKYYHPDANYTRLMQIYNDAINAKKKNYST